MSNVQKWVANRERKVIPCSACGEPTYSKKGICTKCQRQGKSGSSTVRKHKAPSSSPAQLTINFNGYSNVLQGLTKIAKRDIRTLEEQALFYICRGLLDDSDAHVTVKDLVPYERPRE